MTFENLLEPATKLSNPPPGAVNVRIGTPISGPGGRWVPCVTQIASGVFLSSLFEVGPGKRQICEVESPLSDERQALARAMDLAASAAA